MKKILIAATALLALAIAPVEAKTKAPAKAAPAPVVNDATDGFLLCGLLVVPARCTMTERVIGGVVFGAAIGAAVGFEDLQSFASGFGFPPVVAGSESVPSF